MEIKIYEKEPVVLNMGHDCSLKEMIVVANYNFCNYDIKREKLPLTELSDPQKTLLVSLLSFDQRIDSKEVILQMKLKGFRPASLAELIYFEMAYPELCAGVPIIALGSVYRDSFGINSVPQFVADKNGRNLFLDLVDGDWEIGDKFLAVAI
ncbi:MAG: hypothetical protein JST_000305 [Candidatus Parcubacteria bacterium]|jgi:hypothetical protein|nr:MAG: hypothetical protein JST_2770 [Candidatus Parcubacteria bacterium]